MAKKLEGTANLLKNLDKVQKIAYKEAVKVFEGAFAEGETQAKRNAKWTDRTGLARASIKGLVIEERDNIKGILGIGMYYGVFLELANAGKYRIIRPTLNALGPFIRRKLKSIKLKLSF